MTNNKMTAAEFRGIRDACGYTSQYIADVFGYNPRTADLWGAQQGQVVSVPDEVADYLWRTFGNIEFRAQIIIDRAKESGKPINLIRYTSDESFWQDYPEFKPIGDEKAVGIPHGYHNAICWRVKTKAREEGIPCAINFITKEK